MSDRLPLEEVTIGCIFCGSPKVGMAIQRSPQGLICGFLYVCAAHMAAADSLVILKPDPAKVANGSGRTQ